MRDVPDRLPPGGRRLRGGKSWCLRQRQGLDADTAADVEDALARRDARSARHATTCGWVVIASRYRTNRPGSSERSTFTKPAEPVEAVFESKASLPRTASRVV